MICHQSIIILFLKDMVEHFADAILGLTQLDHTPDDSIANMRVLDGLSEAAKTGNTVYLEP